MRLAFLLLLAGGLAAQPPGPSLWLDANGSAELALYRGWPLFVDGLLAHAPRGQRTAAPALVLAPEWANSIRIVIARADGKEVVWPLERLGNPALGALAVPPKGRVPMAWRLPAERTAELEPGAYALVAVIGIKGTEGWNGKAHSAPVTITVEDAPVELTAHQSAELAMLRAREAALTGEPSHAADILLQESSQTQDHVALAAAAAVSLEAAASDVLAFALAEAAINAFRAKSNASVFPPSDLVELRNRLARKILSPRP